MLVKSVGIFMAVYFRRCGKPFNLKSAVFNHKKAVFNLKNAVFNLKNAVVQEPEAGA